MSNETRFAIYTHIQTIKALLCGLWTLVKFTGVAALFLSPYLVVEVVDWCDGRTQEQIEEFIKQNKVR